MYLKGTKKRILWRPSDTPRPIGYLFCAGNRSKGLWLLAKTKDTYAAFMKEDYQEEFVYLSKLSDEEKEWLNTFLQGYYHQNKPAMDKLKFPLVLRRERYNQHRGVKRDMFVKGARIEASLDHIYYVNYNDYKEEEHV